MGLVKTRRLAAMRKQTTYAKATVVKQRAILLRQGYGGLKAGMKPPAMKCGAKKEDDSFWSRNGRKSERKDSR